MSDWRKIVKDTPLYHLWWGLKEVPPVRAVYNELLHRRRDYIFSVLPRFYEAHRSEPLQEDKVLFVENHGTVLSDNFQLLYKNLKRQGRWTIHVHLLQEHTVSPQERDRNYARLLADAATAHYIFLNDASLPLSAVDKRPETIIVQLWHACGAFKKFGMSTADLLFGDDARQRQRHPGYRNLTYVTVSSPSIAWAYEEAMSLEQTPDVIQPVGISRTDVFFDPKVRRRAAAKLQRLFPASAGKRILLYAPTFRGRSANAKTPDYTTFDLHALQRALGEEYCVAIKLHPFVNEKNTPAVPEDLRGSFALDVTHEMTIEELLCAADVCITDYSSLIFEYALLNRPMLFYAYDLADYGDWRGFYYDYDTLTPGPVCRSMEELIGALRGIGDRFDYDRLAAFRAQFMSACDGHATQRILELTGIDD